MEIHTYVVKEGYTVQADLYPSGIAVMPSHKFDAKGEFKVSKDKYVLIAFNAKHLLSNHTYSYQKATKLVPLLEKLGLDYTANPLDEDTRVAIIDFFNSREYLDFLNDIGVVSLSKQLKHKQPVGVIELDYFTGMYNTPKTFRLEALLYPKGLAIVTYCYVNRNGSLTIQSTKFEVISVKHKERIRLGFNYAGYTFEQAVRVVEALLTFGIDYSTFEYTEENRNKYSACLKNSAEAKAIAYEIENPKPQEPEAKPKREAKGLEDVAVAYLTHTYLDEKGEPVQEYGLMTLKGYARPSGLAIVQGTTTSPDSKDYQIVVNNGQGHTLGVNYIKKLKDAIYAAEQLETLPLDWRITQDGFSKLDKSLVYKIIEMCGVLKRHIQG